MRFGKISAALLAIAAIIVVFMVLQLGEDNRFPDLGEITVMVCVALSLVFGIVGLFKDSRKLLSIITTCISAAFFLCPLFATAWAEVIVGGGK